MVAAVHGTGALCQIPPIQTLNFLPKAEDLAKELVVEIHPGPPAAVVLLAESDLQVKSKAWRCLPGLLAAHPSAVASSCPCWDMAGAESMFNPPGKDTKVHSSVGASPSQAASREPCARAQGSLCLQGGHSTRFLPSPKAPALHHGPELFQGAPQGDQGGTDALQRGPARSPHPTPCGAGGAHPAPASRGGVGNPHISWAAPPSPQHLLREGLRR